MDLALNDIQPIKKECMFVLANMTHAAGEMELNIMFNMGNIRRFSKIVN
jgi:hypothetical protein